MPTAHANAEPRKVLPQLNWTLFACLLALNRIDTNDAFFIVLKQLQPVIRYVEAIWEFREPHLLEAIWR